MPFSISKYARGLTSLLDLKERGQGPRLFDDVVQGNVDLTQMYLLQGREGIFSSPIGAPVLGLNTTNLIVPANELWYVHWMNATAVAGAGAAIDLAPGVVMDVNLTMQIGPYTAVAAGQQGRAVAQAPFLATPGCVFCFLARSVVLAPTCDISVFITRLKL
jgi:hypothetical protein